MARSVERLNVNNPEHAGFLFDLLNACKEEFLDDYERDIIVVVEEYRKRLEYQGANAFLCRVNGETAGIIGVSNNGKDVGELLAALMPANRIGLGGNAYRFMDEFIGFCFNVLGYRKLRTMNFKTNQRVERLLRHYGFEKAGFHPQETMKNGLPTDMVELYLTKDMWTRLKTAPRRGYQKEMSRRRGIMK